MLLTFEGTRSLKDLTVIPDMTVSSEKSVLSCLHLRLRSPASIPTGSYQQVSKLGEKFITHMHTPTLVCKRTLTHVCTHTDSIHHVKAMDLCVCSVLQCCTVSVSDPTLHHSYEEIARDPEQNDGYLTPVSFQKNAKVGSSLFTTFFTNLPWFSGTPKQTRKHQNDVLSIER